jgi:hypothetical protein
MAHFPPTLYLGVPTNIADKSALVLGWTVFPEMLHLYEHYQNRPEFRQ